VSSQSLDEQLFSAVQSLLKAPLPVCDESLDSMAGVKGAYALAIQLDSEVPVRLGGKSHVIAPGQYIFAGSAKGPGGIGARVRRHLRRDKRLHWHVDSLTMAASRIDAFALPGQTECSIVERLGGTPLLQHAIAGFGSSDCAKCPSHLLKFDPTPRGG